MREFICTAFLMKEPRILRFKRLRDRQTDRQTDQPTDGRTRPCIEMRGRI